MQESLISTRLFVLLKNPLQKAEDMIKRLEKLRNNLDKVKVICDNIKNGENPNLEYWRNKQ